ncbi:hypothetical protein B0H14DRAFT_2647882 [Mycena olivaceomarginata]|nr:hypothetical protein B0H14DRAFT_2647882 [Mycena olivaceomarginata]
MEIVDPELSESPSLVFGSSPLSQHDGSNTPPPVQPLRSPSPLPTPPSCQKGVKRKAKKEPELEGQKSVVNKMLNNLNCETDHPQVTPQHPLLRRQPDAGLHAPRSRQPSKLRCKVEKKVSYIPRVWHKSELILFAVDLGGEWLMQTAMKLWRNDHRRDLFMFSFSRALFQLFSSLSEPQPFA